MKARTSVFAISMASAFLAMASTLNAADIQEVARTTNLSDSEPESTERYAYYGPAYLDLVSVQVAGSECDTDRDAVDVIDQDTVRFNNNTLMAAAGYGHTRREGRKICQYLLEFEKTPGMQFRLKSTKLDAVASVRGDADGLVKISAFHQGQGSDTVAQKEITSSRTYRNLKINFADSEWSSCDSEAILAVKTEVRADAGASSSDHVHVNLDGPLSIDIEWRSCW